LEKLHPNLATLPGLRADYKMISAVFNRDAILVSKVRLLCKEFLNVQVRAGPVRVNSD